jgi:hypothetical protein
LDGGFGSFEASLLAAIGGEGPLAGAYSLGINDRVQGIGFIGALSSRNDDAVAGYSTPVPEPSTILLLGIGMAGLARLGRRKLKP